MTSQNPSYFLFSLPHSKTPSSDAKVHIRRIYDILQLCIQRGDLSRARRAWIILARCKEVNWRALWRTAICVLDDSSVRESNEQLSLSAIEWLRSMMLQYPNEVKPQFFCHPSIIKRLSLKQESILRELTLRLITAERYREALDQLDL
jgi:RNA polymerase I-specific transcription initiation factor RRN11